MGAIHVTKENFEQEVLQSEKPVLIDFWAAWCRPCKMLSPVIEELSEEVKDAKICKIDIDKEPELAEKYDVMSIPTLLVIKEGEVVKQTVGVQPKAEILEILQ